MTFAEANQWIDLQQEEMVELQAALTATPAIGPEHAGEGEWQKSNVLEQYLARHGFPPAQHFDTPDSRVPEGSRPNFTVLLPGKAERPRIWVMCHTDVVPPGEQLEDGTWPGWQSDPFTMRREGDRIIGRGVEDNQQAIVACVFGAQALLENGLQPAHTVALLFVAEEETGSIYGLRHILRENADMFSPDDIILVPDGGSEDGSLIEIGEKSVL